jgi:hypothetical protein
MSTGGINDGQKGWQLALQHALGDVAQYDINTSSPSRILGDLANTPADLDLFRDNREQRRCRDFG